MGIAVFSGMLGVTSFGIFLTPVFYLLLRTRRSKRSTATAAAGNAPLPPTPQPAAAGAE
jgi:hypothetical protein